ncbi:MAG: ROK family protein [Roseburia sp.]|nr:ROK family protein [Roseburia sp.]MCM1096446.1 ROK family protein [Ruminococcus flavefaciens]
MAEYVAGIDIGGTKCSAALGQIQRTAEGGEIRNFHLLGRRSFATAGTPEKVISLLTACVRELAEENGLRREEFLGLGISCGGPLDHRAGLIKSPPNLPGWDNVPVVRRMEEELGIKARLQNDANACALAEWKFGAGRGCRDMIFLTCGTGLGAGLILDGRLYSGSGDMAGEAGHIRMSGTGPVGYGKAGSLEGFCSGGGIAQLARIKVLERLQMGERPTLCPRPEGLSELTAREVAEAAGKGDPLALEVMEISGEYLGRGLAILIDLLNPEAVVLGSIYERCRHLLEEKVRETVRREALRTSAERCRILPAALGDRIGDYGAFCVACYGGEDER